MRKLQIRNHLFALMVHGGILLAIFILVTATSCQQAAPPPEPDPAGDFFKALMEALDMEGAESVAVIAVDDSVTSDPNLKRQVFQEIQTELHKLETVTIREFPGQILQQKFTEMAIVPSDGISPDDAVRLASDLDVMALLYASIESSAPDVYIKIYSGDTGAVVFAETLKAWPLPVTREEESEAEEFVLPGEPGTGAETGTEGELGAETVPGGS